MLSAEFNSFFKDQSNFPRAKQEILGKYFKSWCEIRLTYLKAEAREKALVYVDLQTDADAVWEEVYSEMAKSANLQEALNTFAYVPEAATGTARHADSTGEPIIPYSLNHPLSLNEEINRVLLAELLEAGCPSLFFVDPFSAAYAQEVLLAASRYQNADLLLLLRADKIVKAVTAKKVSPPLATFFGNLLEGMSQFCKKEKNTVRRQEYVVEQFVRVLQEKAYIPLQFSVNPPGEDKAAFYLLFFSRDKAAYRTYKNLLLAYSDYQQDGVPAFVANRVLQQQLSLFPRRQKYSIPNLAEDLARQATRYKYKSIEKIFEEHHIGTPYVRENYLAAFEQLREQGKIEILNAKTLQAIRRATFASIVKFK